MTSDFKDFLILTQTSNFAKSCKHHLFSAFTLFKKLSARLMTYKFLKSWEHQLWSGVTYDGWALTVGRIAG
jgi:hypothetical protein